MSKDINVSNKKNSILSLDDISGVLDGLFWRTDIDEPPAQREFSTFIRNWCRTQMRSDIHRGLVTKTRSDIQDLLAAAGPEDTELRWLITWEVESMRDSLKRQLSWDILTVYNQLDSIHRKIIDELSANPKVSKVIPVGIMLLLQHIERTNDKKSEWIRSVFSHVHSMSESIGYIRSRTRWSPENKELVFGQFTDMHQETSVALAAIACHIYAEDCSVIMQPIKVKCTKDTSIAIEGVQQFIARKQEDSWEYFPWLWRFLDNPDNRKAMTQWRYLYIPLVVDAKDLLLYLRTMDDFFTSWKRSLEWKKQDKFQVLKNTIPEASHKWVQPRIKFHYREWVGRDEFNIRLDYVWDTLEMDVWWVDFMLQKGWDMINYLERQDRPIMANSYALWWQDTSRIATDSSLSLEEKMALIHSAMMEQWRDILGREECRMFWYHFVLRGHISDNQFSQLQAMF